MNMVATESREDPISLNFQDVEVLLSNECDSLSESHFCSMSNLG